MNAIDLRCYKEMEKARLVVGLFMTCKVLLLTIVYTYCLALVFYLFFFLFHIFFSFMYWYVVEGGQARSNSVVDARVASVVSEVIIGQGYGGWPWKIFQVSRMR